MAVLRIFRQLDDDFRAGLDVTDACVGGEDRVSERVAVREDDRRALGLLLERAGEPLLLDHISTDLAFVEGGRLWRLVMCAFDHVPLRLRRCVLLERSSWAVASVGNDEANPPFLARHAATNSSLARLLAGRRTLPPAPRTTRPFL